MKILSLILALALTGCGTYIGTTARLNGGISSPYETTMIEPLIAGMFIMGSSPVGYGSSTFPSVLVGTVFLIDIPITFVSDTVFLPVDMYQAIGNSHH